MSDGGLPSVDPLAGLAIDRSIDAPPWRQIATYVHDAVVSGELRHGLVLPAERAMARRLGVSRNTVARALSELADTGLLERWVGHGTVVSFDVTSGAAGPTDGIPWLALLTALPPASAEPPAESAAVRRLQAEAARLAGAADRDADSVILATNVDAAARFIFDAMVPAGARVVIETPAPPSVLTALRMRGAELTALPRRSRSQSAALEAVLLAQPDTRLIYLLPSNGYVGLSQSPGEHAHDLGLAKGFGVPVLQDARFAWTRADDLGDPGQAPFLGFDPHDHVIQIGEFDSLAPGGGAAWISVPDQLIGPLAGLARVLNVTLDVGRAGLALETLRTADKGAAGSPGRDVLIHMLMASGLSVRPDCGRGLWLTWPAGRNQVRSWGCGPSPAASSRCTTSIAITSGSSWAGGSSRGRVNGPPRS